MLVRGWISRKQAPRTATRLGKRGTVSTTLYDESLTASDRCDRCGAQAYLRVKFEGGGELLFCAHHAKAHSDKLKQVALKIHDETGKIG